MNKLEDVFRLVQSLSAEEKEYFIKYEKVLVGGDSGQTLTLFDAMNSEVEPKEEDLINLLSVKSKDALVSCQNQLFESILFVLRNYHDDLSEEKKLRNLLKDIEFLYSKSFYKKCYELAKKGKKTALTIECSTLVLHFSRWERRAALWYFDENINVSHLLEKTGKVQSETLKKIENVIEIETIWENVFNYYSINGKPREEKSRKDYDRIFSNHLLKDEKFALTVEAKVIWNNIKGIYYYINNNLNKESKHLDRITEIMQANSFLVLNMPAVYVASLFNASIAFIILKKYDDAAKKIKLIDESSSLFQCFNNEETIVKNFYFSNRLTINLLLNRGKFKELETFLKELENKVEIVNSNARFKLRLELHVSMSSAYYVLGDMENAKKWMDVVLHEKYDSHNQDYASFARILNLILHYERGELEELKKITQSTFKHFIHKDGLFLFENLMVEYFKNALVIREDKGLDLEKSILKDLRILSRNDDNSIPLKEVFNFIYWLESKVQKKTVQTIYLELK